MAQPDPYVRNFGFESFQSTHPATPLPGNEVDEEFDAVAAVMDEVLDRIAILQRDDLELANESVGYDQLKPELRHGFTTPTVWASGVSYELGDSVYVGRKVYAALEAHTSASTFNVDLQAGRWYLLADFTAVTAVDQEAEDARDEAVAAANAAAVSAAAAAASEGDAETAAATAAASATDALAYRDLARLWATEAEDVPVSGGEFSAYHWAQKAEENADSVDLPASPSSFDMLVRNAGNTAYENLPSGTVGRALIGDETAADAADTLGSVIVVPAADRTALAALNTDAFSLAYLGEDGREGQFKRVNTVAYAGWIAADTEQAILVESTHANGVGVYAWLRTEIKELDFRWFGAVADGVDTIDSVNATVEQIKGDWLTATGYVVGDLVWEDSSGTRLGYICLVDHTSGTFATDLAGGNWAVGEFTGTDNTPALQAMVVLHEATGITMFAPEGNFRFVNPTTDVDGVYITLSGKNFVLRGNAEFLIDDGGVAGKNYNFFQTSDYITNEDYSSRGTFKMSGIKFRGSWSHQPGGNTPNARAHIFRISGYDNLVLWGCEFWDVAGSLSRTRTCNKVWAQGNHCERIAKGALRFQDCFNTKVTDNTIFHTNDDAIDCHAAYDHGIRSEIVISGNQLTGVEGIIALGARNTVVANNTLRLPKGTAIYIGGRVVNEGDNAALNVNVSGNVVSDHIAATADGSTLPVFSADAGTIDVGSVQASWIAGDYNDGAGAMRDPLTAAGQVYYNVDLDTTSVPQGSGFTVIGNSIKRTLTAVSNYSDFGFGFYFDDDGWIDPAVGSTSFSPHGLVVRSDVDNCIVNGNAVSGYRAGAGVFLRFLPATVNPRSWSFKNMMIANNTVRDCLNGIDTSVSAGSVQSYYVDIVAQGNMFDLDPFMASAARASATGGAWNSGASDTVKNFGIRMRNLYGMAVIGNTFKNMYEPIYSDDDKSQGYYRSNLVYCDRAAVGFSASNRGVGVPYRSNDEFDHVLVTSTPSAGSGTYGKFTRMVKRFGQVTLANDTATSITPPVSRGKILISTPTSPNAVAEFFYDVATPLANSVFTGSAATLGTTALGGTTGTDNMANFAAANDGKIYIENRLGSGWTFTYKFMDG